MVSYEDEIAPHRAPNTGAIHPVCTVRIVSANGHVQARHLGTATLRLRVAKHCAPEPTVVRADALPDRELTGRIGDISTLARIDFSNWPPQRNFDLVVQLVKTDEDLPRAFAGFEKARAGTVVVQTSPFAAARREKIAELAARHRIPAMYEVPAYVDAGGLIAYGPDGPALTRRSAVFVDKILKGAKAGDLPIEQPTKYQLAINLQAAQALGLVIPQSLLLRADSIRR